jgi:pimeloyl-ACP methyl ester carboxylesterase
MRFAVDYGARRIVLYGWSTGATMALCALARSSVRGRVGGLVLDSPVLDRRSTVRAAAQSHGVPAALVPLAVRAAEGRIGLHAQRIADAAEHLVVPTLVVHGPGDTLAPWAASRELAARHPDLVTLHTVRDAPHAAMWNADPAPYEETLRRFLTPLM